MTRRSKKPKVSAAKARKILRDDSAQGHPLTGKQKKFFGWLAGGGKPRKRGKRR